MDFTIFFQCERWFENLRFENSRIGYIQVGQIWGSFEHSDLEILLLAFALPPAPPPKLHRLGCIHLKHTQHLFHFCCSGWQRENVKYGVHHTFQFVVSYESTSFDWL